MSGEVLLTALIHAVAVYLHLPLLQKAKSRRDSLVFFSLIGVSLAYSCFFIIAPDKIPNPTNLINNLVMGFGQKFFGAE